MSTAPAPRRKPVVGVTTYEEQASFGAWTTRCSVLPVSYTRSVEAAGAIAVLLPSPADGGEAAAIAVVGRLDGIVLTGGPDVDPARYGAAAHPRTSPPRASRDVFEAALLSAADAADLPVLAICRGVQVLNVLRGGTLHQHLPELVGHEDHGELPGEFSEHTVAVVEGTQLAAHLGWDKAAVPTHHHQAIDQVGRGLVVNAVAEDGTIEGAEDPSRRFCVGVQWHPEAGEDLAVFRALVEAATAVVEERLAGGAAPRAGRDSRPSG